MKFLLTTRLPMNFTKTELQIFNELTPNQKNHILDIFEKFPVKTFQEERKLLIKNGRSRYPNGFILNADNEIDIYTVNKK
jgi:hypothetical protein